MIPSPARCHDLPQLVKILVTAVAFLVKTESSIMASLKAISTAYDVLGKKFCQAIKGIKYESVSQCKHKEGQLLTPDRFKGDDDDGEADSSSSLDDEAQAKAPKHKKKK